MTELGLQVSFPRNRPSAVSFHRHEEAADTRAAASGYLRVELVYRSYCWRPGDRLMQRSLGFPHGSQRREEVSLAFLAVIYLLAVNVDLEPALTLGRQDDIGLGNPAVAQLGRHTGSLPEIASGHAVLDLQVNLAFCCHGFLLTG